MPATDWGLSSLGRGTAILEALVALNAERQQYGSGTMGRSDAGRVPVRQYAGRWM